VIDIKKGDSLPENSHTCHYCPPRKVQDGVVLAEAFIPKSGADHLSGNWIEFFGDVIEKSVDEIRACFLRVDYKIRAKGRFVVINSTIVKDTVTDNHDRELQFLFWPENGNDSHIGIFGYSDEDQDISLSIHSTLNQKADVYSAI